MQGWADGHEVWGHSRGRNDLSTLEGSVHHSTRAAVMRRSAPDDGGPSRYRPASNDYIDGDEIAYVQGGMDPGPKFLPRHSSEDGIQLHAVQIPGQRFQHKVLKMAPPNNEATHMFLPHASALMHISETDSKYAHRCVGLEKQKTATHNPGCSDLEGVKKGNLETNIQDSRTTER